MIECFLHPVKIIKYYYFLNYVEVNGKNLCTNFANLPYILQTHLLSIENLQMTRTQTVSNFLYFFSIVVFKIIPRRLVIFLLVNKKKLTFWKKVFYLFVRIYYFILLSVILKLKIYVLNTKKIGYITFDINGNINIRVLFPLRIFFFIIREMN